MLSTDGQSPCFSASNGMFEADSRLSREFCVQKACTYHVHSLHTFTSILAEAQEESGRAPPNWRVVCVFNLNKCHSARTGTLQICKQTQTIAVWEVVLIRTKTFTDNRSATVSLCTILAYSFRSDEDEVAWLVLPCQPVHRTCVLPRRWRRLQRELE